MVSVFVGLSYSAVMTSVLSILFSSSSSTSPFSVFIELFRFVSDAAISDDLASSFSSTLLICVEFAFISAVSACACFIISLAFAAIDALSCVTAASYFELMSVLVVLRSADNAAFAVVYSFLSSFLNNCYV